MPDREPSPHILRGKNQEDIRASPHPFDEIQTSGIEVYEQVKVGYGPMLDSIRLPILRTFTDTTWTTIHGEEIGTTPSESGFLISGQTTSISGWPH